MTITAAPNVTAFVDAQNWLRAQFGTPCQFRVPQEAQWPEGTRINPDTGQPYDALAKRSNAEFELITLPVLLIEKHGGASDTRALPAGLDEATAAVLDVAATDYQAQWQDEEHGPSEFVVNGEAYEVVQTSPFALAGVIYRYLVYGQHK